MRGIKLTLMVSQIERDALDVFGRALFAANSVGRWARQVEGQPYWYADQALRVALVELFGEEHADGIREIHSDCGENVSYCIERYFEDINSENSSE